VEIPCQGWAFGFRFLFVVLNLLAVFIGQALAFGDDIRAEMKLITLN